MRRCGCGIVVADVLPRRAHLIEATDRAPMVSVATLSMGALVWSGVANLVLGDTAYVSRNLGLVTVLLVIGHRLDGSFAPLGIASDTARHGLRWGGIVAGVVGITIAIAVATSEIISPLGALLDDRRADGLTVHALAGAALLRIPLGTVALEEVLFRGLLLALCLRRMDRVAAALVSSLVFGLWHVAPMIVTLRINEVDPASAAGLGSIAGAVVITTLAGLAFSWLRLRSGSLLAPALGHWAANAFGLMAAVVA